MQVHQEKKKAKFRVSFIFLFIIASFAGCFALYMKGDFDAAAAMADEKQDEFNVGSFISSILDKNDEKIIVNPVQESEKADKTYLDNAAFICDSQLGCLSEYNFVARENMYINDTMSLSDIDSDDFAVLQFAQKKQFEAYYIMIGMPDLDKTEDSALFKNLGKLIEDIRNGNKDADIYLVSLLPLTEKYENSSVTNVKVNAFNSEYLKYANENEIYYLDINTIFIGNNGKMPTSAASEGGYKLTKESCAQISEYILTHIGGKAKK